VCRRVRGKQRCLAEMDEREGSEEDGGEGERELHVRVPTVHIAAARSGGEPGDVFGYVVTCRDTLDTSHTLTLSTAAENTKDRRAFCSSLRVWQRDFFVRALWGVTAMNTGSFLTPGMHSLQEPAAGRRLRRDVRVQRAVAGVRVPGR